MSQSTRAIVTTWLLLGVLDGMSAMLVSVSLGGAGLRVWQGVAAGLLGNAAFSGGYSTIALGVAIHFVVALGATLAYYLASRRYPVMLQQPLLCGVLYGIYVDLFMRFVVTPLSAIGWHAPALKGFLAVLLVHVVVVGPTIAFSLSRQLRRERVR